MSKPWTKEEKDILSQNYAKLGAKRIMPLLPHRSFAAIMNQANCVFGLKADDRFRRGKDNHKWKGGKSKTKEGYMLVLAPGEGSGVKRYVYEHRLVIQRHLGRRLTKDEAVHHIDGDRLNNSIENLLLISYQDHAKHHHPLNAVWALKYDRCVQCGTNEIKHCCHGLCRKCHRRDRTEKERKAKNGRSQSV